MTDPRFARLTDGQRDCLRLKLRGFQIKEIASELKIAPSTVNQRLERARMILGAATSLAAARMVAEHEAWPEIWTSVTGYGNPLSTVPAEPSSDPVSSGIGLEAPASDTGDGRTLPIAAPASHPETGFKWPFPTAGRPENDLSIAYRLTWVFPVAIFSLALLLIVALLSLGFQDMVAGLQEKLSHLQ